MAHVKGTKVVIIGGGPTAGNGDYHSFNHGTVVTATGRVYDLNPIWELFEDQNGTNSWLKASHYEMFKTEAVEDTVKMIVLRKEPEKEVDTTLPTKVIYAILNKHDQVLYTTHERDTAREMKSVYGGKKKGVRIFQYAAVKEIR
jgi:hypothetical protein